MDEQASASTSSDQCPAKKMTPAASQESSLPKGEYKVVSIALDTTGKKLIDEICHIGAYYPGKTFSQYVMPHCDVSLSSIRAHGVRIFTTLGKYRVLRDVNTSKILRTKSEYSTLCEFMEWLKEAKGSSDGVLLTYHDNNRKLVTTFLLAALHKYKIMEDFFRVVVGFVDVCGFAADQPQFKDKGVSLRGLGRRLLTADDLSKMKTKSKEPVNFKDKTVLQCAKDRAIITYTVLQKILGKDEDVACIPFIDYATTQADETVNLEKQRALYDKVRSLRPIFFDRLRKGYKDRARAVELRKYLIEGEMDYAMLKSLYCSSEEPKNAIEDFLLKNTSLGKKSSTDKDELVRMIYNHFKTEETREKEGKSKNGATSEAKPNTNGASSAASTETDDEEFEEAQDSVEK